MKSYRITIHCDGTYQGEPCNMAIDGTGTLKQADDELGRAMYNGGWRAVQCFQKPNMHYCPACYDMRAETVGGKQP